MVLTLGLIQRLTRKDLGMDHCKFFFQDNRLKAYDGKNYYVPK